MTDPTPFTLATWLETVAAGAEQFFAEVGTQQETAPLLHIVGYERQAPPADALTGAALDNYIFGLEMPTTHAEQVQIMRQVRSRLQREHDLVLVAAALVTEAWMVERASGATLWGPVNQQPDRIEVLTVTVGDAWGQQAGRIWRIVTDAQGQRTLVAMPQAEMVETRSSLLDALLATHPSSAPRC